MTRVNDSTRVTIFGDSSRLKSLFLPNDSTRITIDDSRLESESFLQNLQRSDWQWRSTLAQTFCFDCLVMLWYILRIKCPQKRIFIFGTLGSFKWGSFWKVCDDWCHTNYHHTCLLSNSLDIRNKTVTMKLTKKAAVKLSDHTPIIYLLSTWQASCNLKNGLKRFIPQIIRNNDQFSTPWKQNAQKWWKLFLIPKFGDPRNRGP